jgi:hypothetical protein
MRSSFRRSYAIVHHFRIRSISSIDVYALPPAVGDLIGYLGVLSFEVLPFRCRVGGSERRVMIRKGLGPNVTEPVSKTAVMLADMICELRHAKSSFGGTYLVRRGDGPTPYFGGRLKLLFTVLRVGGWKEYLNEDRARQARL